MELGWDDEFGGILLARDAADASTGSASSDPWWPYADSKLWWPHTEALYALLIAYEQTGADWALDWFEKVHDYAFSHYPVAEYGEWTQKLDRQGRPFTQTIAQELAQHKRLVLLCGRSEGVAERVRQHLVTDEMSIGDYVLTGGELAAMVVVDAVTRLLPGVLGAVDAAEEDSYATGLLEGPHYTKPADFRGWTVPEVLRSGHAANIVRWRREQALRRTWQRRPDLLLTADLSEADKQYLAKLAEEEAGKS